MAGVVVTIFRDAPADAPADPAGGPPKPLGFEATTDAEGRFHFFDLSPGEWKLLVEAPGFYPFRTTETVAPNEAISATYYVERGSYNPYDVTITATRPRKEVSRTVIDAKLADKIPGTAGDPLAVVQNFAGVARSPAAGLLIVRGSAPEDTQVFADGAEIPLIYHFGGLRSVLPVGILDSIEFYPGNFSPHVRPRHRRRRRHPDQEAAAAQAGRVRRRQHARHRRVRRGPHRQQGRASPSAGRRSYIDFIINAAVPDDADVNLVTAPRYYDFQLLGNYRPAAAHDLRAFFFASDDQLKILFQNPADVDTTFSGNSLSSQHVVLPDAAHVQVRAQRSVLERSALVAGPQQIRVPRRSAASSTSTSTRSSCATRSATACPRRSACPTASTCCTARPTPWCSCRCRPRKASPRATSICRRCSAARTTTWSNFNRPLTPSWNGARCPACCSCPGCGSTAFRAAIEVLVQPRMTARWELNDRFLLKGGAGLFMQEPDVQQGEADATFGNPNLTAERAKHYSFGVEYKPRPVHHLGRDRLLQGPRPAGQQDRRPRSPRAACSAR